MPPRAPRDAGAPEPSARGARLTLERAEVRRVSDVRRDGEHVGIALAQDLGVEEPAVGQPEIGEQPAVAIPPLDVELELDRLVAETAGGELGRPAAPGKTTVFMSRLFPAIHPSGRRAGPSTSTSTAVPTRPRLISAEIVSWRSTRRRRRRAFSSSGTGSPQRKARVPSRGEYLKRKAES